jgi:hypothetical protein
MYVSVMPVLPAFQPNLKHYAVILLDCDTMLASLQILSACLKQYVKANARKSKTDMGVVLLLNVGIVLFSQQNYASYLGEFQRRSHKRNRTNWQAIL